MSDTLKSQHGIDISPQTVRYRLGEAGFVARIKIKKPMLTEDHRVSRLGWAKSRLGWTEEDWGQVLWSDESKFKIYMSDGRQWVWRKQGSPLGKNDVTPTVKFGGGHVMVWGCISSAGVGNLCKIVGTMDGPYYVDILEDNLLESAADLFGENEFIFQQDNDPSTQARLQTSGSRKTTLR